MSNNDNDKLMDHDYDGIQELNNPLPRWWLLTFYATIVFSIGYYFYYELMDGPDSDQRLEKSLASLMATQEKLKAEAPKAEDLDFNAITQNSDQLAKGKEQYTGKCAACHGMNGEGGIGPNLTDNYWIHSKGQPKGILQTIKVGVTEKGMPAWDSVIPADEQAYLAAYIFTLKGTNPANAKEPQGEKVE
jgi:cytochrome c oxidase cbb3-type subunit 3